MWGLKRTENISWTEKTNEKVLAMVGEKRRLMEKMIKTKKRWTEHVLGGNGLLKEVVEGIKHGKIPREEKAKHAV